MGTRFILLIALALIPGPSDELEVKVIENIPVTAGPYNFATLGIKILDPNDEGFAPHKHAGHKIGVVLEGEYLLQVDEQPPVILSAGQSYTMPATAAMVWGANASNNTKCQLFFVIFKKDDTPLLIFEKERGDYHTVLKTAKRQANDKIE